MNYQGKSRIPKGTSFTPVFDHLVDEVGLIKTAIVGVIWRYSQMSDKVCRASQNSIAAKLNLSRQTLNKHLSELITLDYVQDLTPKVKNRPHLYLLTDKVFRKITEREIRIKSGTILEKSEITKLKIDPSLSIFEMFGVNNLYMKRDIKNKEINREEEADDAKNQAIRNISNNQLVDLLVYRKQYKLADINPFCVPDKDNPFFKVINFFHFGFLWNIFTIETDLANETKFPFARTVYRITDKGINYIQERLNNDPDSMDMDKMAEVVDFWFWYTLEGNARIEDIDELFTIYENNQILVHEFEHPEIYRKSREIRVITRAIGREPPIKLFPEIYKAFDVINPLGEYDYLKELFDKWISLGNNKNDLSWFFDQYN